MTKVVFDISMSLDGFATAADPRTEEPLGDGGERLHTWVFGDDERDRTVLAEGAQTLGAVVAGRRTYDHAVGWWGADGPTGPARLPVFVLTHAPPTDAPAGGVYTFVTDGVAHALAEARAAAGSGDVAVMGGADLGRQVLREGLLDELSIHLVPVLFGAGTRLFDHLGTDHTELEILDVTSTSQATHLRYRVAGAPRA